MQQLNNLLNVFMRRRIFISMKYLRKNLVYLFSKSATTPHAAARVIGVSQPTINRLMNDPDREPNSRTVRLLAEFFKVSVDELMSADLEIKSSGAAVENFRPGPDIQGLVPLLTSVQAGHWCEIEHAFQRQDAREWVPCPVKHGPRTFCLVVEGESMRNPGNKPSYEPGDVIFVDPDVAPKPGDRVVAQLDGQVAATFKQYLEEDGRKILKALNPDWTPRYTPINGEARICGVVIGKWVAE